MAERMKKNCNKNSSGLFLYLAFIAIVTIFISFPGFCYFFFYQKTDLSISIIGGFIIGFFLYTTIEYIFGVSKFIIDLIKRITRRSRGTA